MTKAGSVSLMGECNSQKAKIYSTRSPAQSELIQEVSDRLQNFTICLPKIIARDEKYIAEEWIEGVSGNQVEEITSISAIGQCWRSSGQISPICTKINDLKVRLII